MFFIGRHDLRNLWSGARAIKLAERLIDRNERAWGKARMKRLVERLKRENAALVVSHGQTKNESNNAIDCDESPSPPILPTSGERQSRTGLLHDGQEETQEESNVVNSHYPTNVKSRGREIGGTNAPDYDTHQTRNAIAPPTGPGSASVPTSNDICFGDRSHPGTIELQEAVKYVYDTNEGAQFDPEIFKSIRRMIAGRDYYYRPTDSSSEDTWRRARKREIRDEIWRMYDDYRLYLVQSTSQKRKDLAQPDVEEGVG